MTDFEIPTIYVLAGVNGAGKSSIGGAEFQGQDSSFYNPDLAAATIRAIHPLISDTEANSHAWKIGRTVLEQAIAKRVDFRFETTLGGNTIPQLLEQATGSGLRVQIWFAGLSSPELHIQRVAARVARGVRRRKSANAGIAAGRI